MGVRFACHACHKRLNVKSDLAGKRGKCPKCGVRIRIPVEDAEWSTPIEPANPAPASLESTAAEAAPKIVPASEPEPIPASEPEPIPASEPEPMPVPAEPTPSPNRPTAVAEQAPATPRPPASSDHPASDVSLAETTPSIDYGNSSPSPAADLMQEASLPIRRFAQLDSAPDAIWYVRPSSGGQYGPAGGDLLCEWIDQGRVSSSSLLWRDGWTQWRSAEEVLPELNIITPPVPAVAAPAAIPPPAVPPGIPPAPLVADPTPRIVVNDTEPEVQGDNQPGIIRSKRKQKRIKIISLMLAISLLLIGALVVAIISTS